MAGRRTRSQGQKNNKKNPKKDSESSDEAAPTKEVVALRECRVVLSPLPKKVSFKAPTPKKSKSTGGNSKSKSGSGARRQSVAHDNSSEPSTSTGGFTKYGSRGRRRSITPDTLSDSSSDDGGRPSRSRSRHRSHYNRYSSDSSPDQRRYYKHKKQSRSRKRSRSHRRRSHSRHSRSQHPRLSRYYSTSESSCSSPEYRSKKKKLVPSPEPIINMAQLKSALKKVLPQLSPPVKPKSVPAVKPKPSPAVKPKPSPVLKPKPVSVVKPKPIPSEKVVQQTPGRRKRSLSIAETPRPNNSEQVQPGKRQKRAMSTAGNYLVLLSNFLP